MAASVTISDLRDRPGFADTVADRVWRAWWKPKDHPLSTLRLLVAENLDADPVPSALVAHEGDSFLGTASLIACDLDERSSLTPWVAAVWVEPAHRGRGIGAALVRAGAGRARELGYERAYLCALPPHHAFYARLGWRMIEAGVTPEGLALFASH